MTKLERRVAACTAIIDAARTESGDRAEAYGNRGIAYYNNGDKRQAVKDLQQAIAIEETSASSYRFRGIIHLAERDYAKAFVRFDEAIRREPNNALAFGARGGAFLNNKDFDRAIADYDEALRLDPTFTLALRNRAVAYVEKGDYDRAIADCDSVVRTYADSLMASTAAGGATPPRAIRSERWRITQRPSNLGRGSRLHFGPAPNLIGGTKPGITLAPIMCESLTSPTGSCGAHCPGLAGSTDPRCYVGFSPVRCGHRRRS